MAIRARTTASGCAIARIPRCAGTSRPRTRTPSRSWRPPRRCRRRSTANCVARIQETDLSVPERDDGWLYYHPHRGGEAVPDLLPPPRRRRMPRRKCCSTRTCAPTGHAYFRLGALEVSPDHRRLAYAVDTSGSEEFTLRVKDLDTGIELPDAIPGASGNLAWAGDSGDALLRHARRRPSPVVRAAPPPGRRRGGRRTRAPGARRRRSSSASSCRRAAVRPPRVAQPHHLRDPLPPGRRAGRLLPPRAAARRRRRVRPHRPRRPVLPRHQRGRAQLPARRACRSDDPAAPWKVVIPPDRASEARRGSRRSPSTSSSTSARTGSRRCGSSTSTPGRSTASPSRSRCTPCAATRTPSATRRVVRFTYTSLVTPASVDRLRHGRPRPGPMRKQHRRASGYDPTLYRSARTPCHGARTACTVPMSLVWKEPLERDGTRPDVPAGLRLLRARATTRRSPRTYLSLLDRGFVVAIAHVRGGEELGRALVRRRQAAAEEEHLHRLHRLRRAPGAGRATPRPTGWRSRAAAPAAC